MGLRSFLFGSDEEEDKQARYDELEERFDAGTSTDEEITESVRLWYELNPDMQYWRDERPDLEPPDIWPESPWWKFW